MKISNFQFPISKFWNLVFIWSLIFGAWNFTSGCANKPTWEYMPDMADQPSLKAQKYQANMPHHRGMLTPPEGTIPRGYQPYAYAEDPEGAAKNLKNPLVATKEVLLAGQKVFNTYCIVCHGPKGFGDGSVVPPFPKPPSLQSEKIRNLADGGIFHIITKGQNLMPSYASQIPAASRWAVIYYLRAMQKAENPTPEDVEAYKQYRMEKGKDSAQ